MTTVTTMLATTPLGRRGFGALLLATAGAVVVRPSFGLGATDDPPMAVRTVKVGTSAQLNSALANALPGDHILLANGTYTGSRTLSRAGTAGAPIVVKSEALLGATLTGTLTLAGRYTIAYGLKFTGNVLGIQFAADDTAVLRCWFTGPRGTRATSQKRVRIGYNLFSGGPISGQSDPHHVFFDVPRGTTTGLPEGGRVYRNSFASPSGSGASQETRHIYIGEGGGQGEAIHPSLTDFRIEYNRISDSVRRRGIYTKRGGTLQFNHVIGKGPGVTGIRHGGRGSVSGNRCDNIDSVIINGPDHQVQGNWVRTRRGLVLECERRTSSGIIYNAAHNALLVGNNANRLVVGNFESGDTLLAPVSGVRIYNHLGPVVLMKQVNTVQTTDPSQTAPTPITLLPSQVGPFAP
jgi:hypothetical protein